MFWSHRGDKCTFDTMIEELGLASIGALARLAVIVRGADTAHPELAPQSAGLLAASLGLSRMYADDLEQLEAGMLLYDAFYRWCRDAVDETHDWVSHKPQASPAASSGLVAEARPTLAAIFARFLRFGLLAWGGPVAQIAMIKRELVEEEKWLTPERFNRLLAVYQVLPGPEAHELCVHLGMMKRGRLGGILAGLGFMLPGFLLILVLAWVYQRLDLHQPLSPPSSSASRSA